MIVPPAGVPKRRHPPRPPPGGPMRLMRQCVLLSFPVLATLLACSDPSGPSGAPPKIDRLPRPLTAAEQGVIQSSNAFAFSLLREVNVAHQDSNVFISPLSASMALGM